MSSTATCPVSSRWLDRLATCYQFNPQARALQLFDGIDDSQWSRPPAFPDGGAGLVSTIDDYLAFGQMMLNKGKHTERILSRLSMETMTTDQLTPELKAARRFVDGSAGTAAMARPGIRTSGRTWSAF
jgi:CubicO group peptidase (beta-lactamase class C family)